jgi:hypothetical protein
MTSEPAPANLSATAILDYQHPAVATMLSRIGVSHFSQAEFVMSAHGTLGETMGAVYSIDDTRPASRTIELNEGSCAQRMACLETLARGYRIATRVRALWLFRAFWFSRLPLLKSVLPARMLMPWPQFYIDGRWVDFDEVYGPIAEIAEHAAYAHPFTNAGESLFDAVRHTPVDFFGKLKATPFARYDLSAFVAEDTGFFDTRDELMRVPGAQNSKIGKLIFDVLYGGRPIRRQPD